ncbi:MAG TPA: GFA family protein [Rhodopila sp.]|nr:GFA family protein [Rhodopila sp.]
MYKTQPTMTGGCQCGAVRYALFAQPESTVCHCRMCQKAVGGPFAALAKVAVGDFVWTRGEPARFQSSSVAERHFCASCGTPLTFHFLDGTAIEVTTGSLDSPALAPATKNFGVEARLPWIGVLVPGALPDSPTAENATRVVVSRQHPDHDTPDGWSPPNQAIV